MIEIERHLGLERPLGLGRVGLAARHVIGERFGLHRREDRLGAARIMLFHDDKADVDNCWQMFVQDGDEKPPQARQERQEGQGQEKTPKATSDAENAPNLPFHDDGLGNLLQ